MIGRVLLRELSHRPGGALAVVLVIAVVAGTCTGLTALDSAAQRETRRIMRDMGFNLRIIPAGASLESLYVDGYCEETMPEDVIHRLAGQKTVAYNHLVASLQQRIDVGGRPAILVGLSGTYFPPGQKKPPMVFEMTRGEAHLGWEIATRLALAAGDNVEIAGRTFKVSRVMPPARNLDDVRVIVHLADAQEALGAEGKINEIKAIDCLCLTADKDPEAMIQEAVQKVAPEAQAVMVRGLADARARQRQLLRKVAQTGLPAALVAAMLIVGLLAHLNARAREAEIGLLHALGYGSGTIVSLIAGKVVILGLLGGLVGAVGGSLLAVSAGAEMVTLTKKAVSVDWQMTLTVACMAPVLAATAAFPAIAAALSRDPADVLAGEQ